MDKCPYCGAETRPGDNFCLNCGNRLLSATPSYQQAQPVIGDATIPASSDSWSAPAAVATGAATAGSGWNDASDQRWTKSRSRGTLSYATIRARSCKNIHWRSLKPSLAAHLQAISCSRRTSSLRVAMLSSVMKTEDMC